jgi:hypothetical protein
VRCNVVRLVVLAQRHGLAGGEGAGAQLQTQLTIILFSCAHPAEQATVFPLALRPALFLCMSVASVAEAVRAVAGLSLKHCQNRISSPLHRPSLAAGLGRMGSQWRVQVGGTRKESRRGGARQSSGYSHDKRAYGVYELEACTSGRLGNVTVIGKARSAWKDHRRCALSVGLPEP